ncbi:MAG TPA: helix-turn-helix domain-containing protein [Corynebacterium sp.]|nr:helix-turn-helix domain-containing protein [Corynebacterium sp.]
MLRSKIVLECATGVVELGNDPAVGVSLPIVAKWRSRFLAIGLDGLVDESWPGRPAPISVDQVEQVIMDTVESTPPNATHWSRASMAEKSGLSTSTVGRIWKALGLKPCREEGFELSTDSLCAEKVVKPRVLEKDLRHWVQAWNEDRTPFIWTKTAEEILASIARHLKLGLPASRGQIVQRLPTPQLVDQAIIHRPPD